MQESLYRIWLCCSWQGRQKSGKMQQFCQIITILCPLVKYGAYGPQGIKLINQIGKKKIQEATDEKLSAFLSYEFWSTNICYFISAPQNQFKAVKREFYWSTFFWMTIKKFPTSVKKKTNTIYRRLGFFDKNE